MLEFNARFGDPETQAILPRLQNRPARAADCRGRRALAAASDGVALDWDPRPAVTVVLASAGYPETSSSGDVIPGLDATCPQMSSSPTPGPRVDARATLVTAGGRVLRVTALGADFADARASAYAAADRIDFDGRQLRRDIAERVVAG